MDATNARDLKQPIKRLLELYADGSENEEIRSLLVRMKEIAVRVDERVSQWHTEHDSRIELELDADALVILVCR